MGYRKAENGADEGTLVITRQLRERRLQYRYEFVDHPLIHPCRCLFNHVINLRMILMLEIRILISVW